MTILECTILGCTVLDAKNVVLGDLTAGNTIIGTVNAGTGNFTDATVTGILNSTTANITNAVCDDLAATDATITTSNVTTANITNAVCNDLTSTTANVTGLTCDNLQFTDSASAGRILTCVNVDGDAAWQDPSGSVTAETIVDASGDGDYLLLSTALAAGARNIFIKPGTYNEPAGIALPATDGVFIRGAGVNNAIIDFDVVGAVVDHPE
jgi:hypothetical protein